MREEPDGLGSLKENDAREAKFRMPEPERIPNRAQEKLRSIATVEDLLRHEIAFREEPDLVLPAQFTGENPYSSSQVHVCCPELFHATYHASFGRSPAILLEKLKA